jgi:light-regulated signal transduction histidine kinase (bacteriophytochrome)
MTRKPDFEALFNASPPFPYLLMAATDLTILGLGLALVKSLAELHGGSVAADSKGQNKGSGFTARLPRLAKKKNVCSISDCRAWTGMN